MQLADRKQSIHAFFHRFADPDEDPCRERNLLPSCIFNHAQALRRVFIRSVVVGCARREQAHAGRFQHQSHTGGNARQTLQPLRAHQTGIRMRKQTRFPQYQVAHGFQILQSRFVAKMVERFAHLRKEQLGLVAQAEESFRTTEAFPGANNLHDFVGRHGMRSGIAGIAPERAVAAVVAAQIREWNKNFARIGYDAGLEAVACALRGLQQGGKIVLAGAQKLAGCGTRDCNPILLQSIHHFGARVDLRDHGLVAWHQLPRRGISERS